MACKGNLTGSVLGAAGALVTNGALPEVFGAEPLSSELGVPIEIDDFATGETISPTLNTLVTKTSEISGQSWASSLTTSLDAMNASGSFTDTMKNAWNNIGSGLSETGFFDAIGGFANSANDTLKNVVSGITKNIDQAVTWAGQTIGGSGTLVDGILKGDPKKFGNILNTATSFTQTANQLVNGAINSDAIASTFTNMNNITSGGLAGINLDFGGFGAEIAKLGGTINLESLQNLGSPGQLLANMEQAGTLGPMYDKVANIDVDQRTINQLAGSGVVKTGSGGTVTTTSGGSVKLGSLGVDANTVAKAGAALPSNVQKQIYNGFASLTKGEVTQVKSILNNTVSTVVSGADLLDPKKLLPTSFETLTAPLRTSSVGYRAIYSDESGSVNPEFNALGGDLENIVPEDIAVANGALARSLAQIKNIGGTSNLLLGTAAQSLETYKDLDLIQNQSQYVTTAIQEYWTETYQTDSSTNIVLATGDNGQMTVSDIIGFAAGYNSAAPIAQNVTLFQELQDAGDLAPFTQVKGVYDTIDEFVAGTFGPVGTTVTITAGYVGEGVYTGATAAEAYENAFVNGIIPATKTICEGFTSNTKVQTIIRNSKRWNEQLAREYINQTNADNQDLTAVQSSEDVAINLATSLPDLGLDTSAGGTAELLERIVNFGTLGGQSVIASMREGRNLARLNAANIDQDAPIDTEGTQTAGTLLSGQYTQSEAQSQIIKN